MPIPAPSLPDSVLERTVEVDSQSQHFMRRLRQIQGPKVNESLAVQQRNFAKNHFIVSAMGNSLTVASCLEPTSFSLFYFSHNLSLMPLLLTSCLIVTELHSSLPFAA